MMVIIGVTGQVAMGKSVVARMLCQCGFRLYDADRHAHELLSQRGVRKAVQDIFGGGDDGRPIDRAWLRKQVLAEPAKLRALEAILHPRLKVLRERLIVQGRVQRWRGIVLDVPLLFESGGDKRCHLVITVSSPSFIQQARLKKRGLTDKEIKHFIGLQMSDDEKKRRADYVVPTGQGLHVTRRRVEGLVRRLRGGDSVSLNRQLKRRTLAHLRWVRHA
ncbi:MAG: dephospho-CoA kinase [Alphaproteobacteria bacterium GM202ARS2]|nr:dephospho-CoA kinase [Alphaproteobacteria bacterium GM202ARS2]